MNPSVPKDRAELATLVEKGEGRTLEFKRSTAELHAAMQTVCAFLNGRGGLLIFGVRPDGTLEGQQVSDKTIREVVQALDGFEPPVILQPARVPVGSGREALIVAVDGPADSIPYSFQGRAYERRGSSTAQMSQEQYEQLLLERTHSRRRWENLPAEGTSIRDIDREEVMRVFRAAREAGRLSGSSRSSLPDLLDRLGVRREGEILRAAVVLFGKKFLPDFPQCGLRMARFRGTNMDEFLDQRQIHGPAFRLLEEAELFAERHLPVAAKNVPGKLQRVESPLIPPLALREILVNAFTHRDYSIAGGAVSLAIYDDRVEVLSAGAFPRGITPESLSGSHLSVPRNPIIADVFHRAAFAERWGRGTNRVIEMCRAARTAEPEFADIPGGTVVTFRVPVGRTTQVTPHVPPHVTPHVTPQIRAILRAASKGPAKRDSLQAAAKIRDRKHFRVAYLDVLLRAGWLERTNPDAPRDTNQAYTLTSSGRRVLAKKARGGRVVRP